MNAEPLPSMANRGSQVSNPAGRVLSCVLGSATKLTGWRGAPGKEMLPLKYIVAGDFYRDPQMDLQLPRSHLAFRIPAGFTGRLSADGAFKLFSADRKLSCFVLVHSVFLYCVTGSSTARVMASRSAAD